jgi:peptidyl-prolyl cis-trans isomerase SurA
VQVGETDIDQAIEQRAANAGETEYLLGEIYLPIGRDGDRQVILAQAEKLVDELLKGAPFTAIARQFSRGPTAEQGGDIGWNRLDQLNNQLADTVKQMRVGSLSKPIPTRDGVYILALRDKRVIKPFAAGQTQVTLSQLVLPLPDDVTDQQIKDQRQRAEKIAQLVGSCDQLESVGDRISPGDSGPLGQIKQSELSPVIAGAIDGLNSGDISDPIRRQLPGGDGWVLIMVCDKQTGNMEEVRTQIANQLGNERLNRLQEQYLRDLRQSAFIDIRLPSDGN